MADFLIMSLLLCSLIALFVQAVIASRDQARAVRAGEPVGSLWQHMMLLHRRREIERKSKAAKDAKSLNYRPKPLTEAQHKALNLKERKPPGTAPSPKKPVPAALAPTLVVSSLVDAIPSMSEVETLDVEFDYSEESGAQHRYFVMVEKVGAQCFAGYCGSAEMVFRFDRIIGEVNLFAEDIDVSVEAFRTVWLSPFGQSRAAPDECQARFDNLHPDAVAPQVVSFLYENSQGELSSRQVTVEQVGTSHFAGMCHRENAERTFRFDRIQGSVTDEASGKLITPRKLRDFLRGYGEQEVRRQNRARAKNAPEILFTGFKQDRRAVLEEQAEAAGMTVRKRVTENLDFLCGGYNAGPSKLADARANGVTVLNEEQFEHLLVTGEVPG